MGCESTGQLLSTDEVKNLIEAGIGESTVQVTDLTGTSNHFDVVVVSPAFEGLSLIKRHQLVYAALGDAMSGPVHALKLKTLTPEQTR